MKRYAAQTVLFLAVGAAIPAVSDSTMLGRALLVLGLLVPLGVLALGIALTRFPALLLAAVLARMALDGFHSTSAANPATAVGALFAVAAVARLWAHGRDGTLVPPSALTKALYVFTAAAAASAMFSDHRSVVAQGVLRVATGALMFGVLEQELAGDEERARKILTAVQWSLLVPGLFAIAQLVQGTGNGETRGFNRVFGTAVHPTSFATYLLIICASTMPFVLSNDRTRKRATFVLLAAAGLLFATYTRSAWLAAAAGGLFYLWKEKRALLIPAALAFAALLMFVPGVSGRFADLEVRKSAYGNAAPNSYAWRRTYWGDVADLGKKNPLTGIGLGATVYETNQGLPPHNIALQAYVEIGVLGALALAAVVLAYAKEYRRRIRAATTELERLTALAMGVGGVMLLVEGMATNLLGQTLVYWYLAAGCAYGFGRASGRPHEREPLDRALVRR